MSITIAEYVGQRPDVPNIISPANYSNPPQCPFMNSTCKKIDRSKPQKPVCSIRLSDGSIWIVCPHRLCSTTKKYPLSNYQNAILHEIAKSIFYKSIKKDDVYVRREVRIPVVGSSNYSADYIMMTQNFDDRDVKNKFRIQGPSKVVLEMQGGGETSSTGSMTKHVTAWESAPNRTNQMLLEPIDKTAPIVTNAWRRQQEQFIIKGNIVMQTGGAMVFAVGAPLYDYLNERIKDTPRNDLEKFHWTLALISIKEDTSKAKKAGPVPLVIDHNRTLFTEYIHFVQTLIRQGKPNPKMFSGNFDTLSGKSLKI